MTVAKFEAILGAQMADADKRARADFVIDTSQDFDHARRQVRQILDALRARA
jgi:dephospho-CoA kinase